MGHSLKAKKQSILLKKMISWYIILLLIPGIVASLLYYVTIHNYLFSEEKVLVQNTLTQFCKDVDQNLSTIEDVCYQLQQHNNFVRFLNHEYKRKVDQVGIYQSEFSTMFSYAIQYSPYIQNINVYMLKDGLLEMGSHLRSVDELDDGTVDIETMKGFWRYDKDSNLFIYRKTLKDRTLYTDLAIMEVYCSVEVMTDILYPLGADYGEKAVINYKENIFNIGEDVLQTYDGSISGNTIVSADLINIPITVQIVLDNSMSDRISAASDNRLSFSILTILVAIILLSMVYFIFVFHYSKRIANFSNYIASSYTIVPDKYEDDSDDDIGKLIQNFNTMIENNNYLLNQVRIEQLQKNETAYKVLQMQIDPHFIYNSLEGIRMLAEMKNETDISDMIFSLSRLMRYTFSANTDQVILENELEYVKQYLVIQKMRLAEKITFEINSDPAALKYKCPKFIVQPMVENAIKYGFGAYITNIHIRIELLLQDGIISILVEDNGLGIEDDVLADMNIKLQQGLSLSQYASGNGIGLENVNGRMRFLHPETFQMIMKKTEEKHGLSILMKWMPEED